MRKLLPSKSTEALIRFAWPAVTTDYAMYLSGPVFEQPSRLSRRFSSCPSICPSMYLPPALSLELRSSPTPLHASTSLVVSPSSHYHHRSLTRPRLKPFGERADADRIRREFVGGEDGPHSVSRVVSWRRLRTEQGDKSQEWCLVGMYRMCR